jgi:hypothetical protein
MDTATGWLVLAVFYILPLLHVALSRTAGPWGAPKGARCPFSPRVGWVVIVLLLGPVGWLLFVFRRRGRTPA